MSLRLGMYGITWVFAGCGPPVGAALEDVPVERAVDGDTLVVDSTESRGAPDGTTLQGSKIRLIGVDAPELHGGSQDCFAREAHQYVRSRVEGQRVSLAWERAGPVRDRFGRVLAYVSSDSEVVNEALVREGFAVVLERYPFRDRSRYLELEGSARARGAGLWSACR